MATVLRTRTRVVALVSATALIAAFWAATPRVAAGQEILRVPSEVPTLQDAVAAANPGDMILLEPGVYPGGVEIPESKDGLTIRGLDRNAVVFDGEFERNTAITAYADNVKMENMTARNFRANGFYWRSVDGYEGRYLTTYRVGLYGIYAFDSVNGIFEKSYASGSGDASFYIGQCRPCDAVIDDVIAEYSALGYSGTNAGGNLVIQNSVWRNNAAGIVPNSLDSQNDPPQRDGTHIVGNLIEANGNEDVPGSGLAGAIIGHGVGIAGGEDNVVEGNVIRDNRDYGVVIFPIPGGPAVYPPNNNTVRDNELSGNGGADLAISVGNGTDNCFEGNDFSTSAPEAIEDAYPCDGGGLGEVPVVGDPVVGANLAHEFVRAQTGTNNRPSYQETPEPEPQPTMPDPDPDA